MRSQLHITWRDLLDWMRHCERRTKGARVVVPHHQTGQAHHRYDAIAPLLEFRRTRGLASRRGAEGGGGELKFERACGRSCTRVIRSVEEFTLSKTIN